MRVLLVEDEQPLARYVAAGLRKHGFVVDVALDGRVALDKCTVTPYKVWDEHADRSPTRCGSPSAHCAESWVTRHSSTR
jgi:hypothetical protein